MSDTPVCDDATLFIVRLAQSYATAGLVTSLTEACQKRIRRHSQKARAGLAYLEYEPPITWKGPTPRPLRWRPTALDRAMLHCRIAALRVRDSRNHRRVPVYSPVGLISRIGGIDTIEAVEDGPIVKAGYKGADRR